MGHILKHKQNKNKWVCIHDIMRLIIMKMKMKMKNRSHRHDMKGARPRHGHKYSKYKKCVSMMMFICTKQHLSHWRVNKKFVSSITFVYDNLK